MILPDCKIVSKNAGEIIFQYDLADKINHFTYVIEGDVMVTRTIDDEEVSQGKSVENSFFGAYKHLRKALLSYSLVREEEEEEVPILQGGNGVKNTIIKAATPVTLMRMRSTHLLRLLEVKGRNFQALVQHLQLEDPARDLKFPLYSLQATWKRGIAETIFCPGNDEIVFFERSRNDSQICGVVSELQRKKIKETISAIEKIWAEITQGAPIIPLGTMRMIEEYLGEGGEQFFADLIKPLSRPGAPACLHPEHFWFCCIEFLSETMMSTTLEESGVSNVDTHGSDGNMTQLNAEDSVHDQQDYVSQKDAVMTDSDLYIFEEKETLKQKFENFMFKDRQIESRFVEVPQLLIETEFIRVAGELTGYLMGDAIRKYLTYTLVHHPYPISLANCREFCTLFGKPFDQSTKLLYPEIVKLLRDKKIQSQDQDGLFVGSALNPGSLQMQVWIFLMRLVALYHMLMVPIRIAFMPYPHFTSLHALVSDGPMDVALGLHSLISLNTAFRDAKSSWITDRIRVFRETDFLCLFASIPCDWFGYLTGFSMEGCVWLRLNKMMLYYSRISPRQIIYSKGEVFTIGDLLVVIFLVLHICASIYFFLGRAARHWQAEMGRPQISWFFIEDDFKDLSLYERSEDFHFVFGEDTWVVERYLFSLYWVATSVTVSGQVGKFLPQNVEEIIFTIGIMILNMTVYRWIIGEVSSIIMSADDSIVKAREDLERLTTFSSSKRFSDELREEIKSHFDAVQSGSSLDQDKLLSGLSHGLRVDLARFISREFLPKIDLFQGCSHQMLDSICVLLIEVNFMPEEIVFRTGEIAKEMYFVLQGALEELDDDQDKVVRTARKNSALGTIPFSFGLRHFATARASRSGCVCMRLTRENLFEVLKTHPKDEETVMQNSLRTLTRESTAVNANDAKSTDGRSDRGNTGDVEKNDKKSMKSSVSSGSKRSKESENLSGSLVRSRSGSKKSERQGSDHARSHHSGSSGKHSLDRKSHHSRLSRASRASRTSKAKSSAVKESAVNGEGSQKGLDGESSQGSVDDGSDVSAPLFGCRHCIQTSCLPYMICVMCRRDLVHP